MADLFIDAGYWIALWNPRDHLHERARTLDELVSGTAQVTTRPVLIETMDHFAGLGPRSRRAAGGLGLTT